MVTLVVIPDALIWAAAIAAVVLVGYVALRVFVAGSAGRAEGPSVPIEASMPPLPFFARPLVASGVIFSVLAVVVLLPAILQRFPAPAPATDGQPDSKFEKAKAEAEMARSKIEMLSAKLRENEQALRSIEEAASELRSRQKRALK
jgi:hypothetical protein